MQCYGQLGLGTLAEVPRARVATRDLGMQGLESRLGWLVFVTWSREGLKFRIIQSRLRLRCMGFGT